MADLLMEHRAGSAPRLRALLYSLLKLPEPEHAAYYRPLPDLPESPDDVTAWRIDLRADDGEGPEQGPAAAQTPERGSGRAGVRLRRFPAGAPVPRASRSAVRPLVVDAEDVVVPRWGSADAWSNRRGRTEQEAVAWLEERVRTYPKTLVAVAALSEGTALLLHRSGAAMRVHRADARAGGARPTVDASIVAAAAVGWAREGLPWRSWHHRVRVRLGARTLHLKGSPPPAGTEFSGGG